MAEFAGSGGSICRSRRFPDRVKAAFLSAEDKNFYSIRAST
jgi:membrane carboxypeptidase/penicillin-binding protein